MSSQKERLEKYNKAVAALEQISDEEIAAKLFAAKQVHSGIGGSATKLEIAGVAIFAKKVALTDLEKQNPFSTKNLFDLPIYYQYGIGSSGFGVWREIACHQITTKWVFDGECLNFPLMYGFKILPRDQPAKPINEEVVQIRKEFWNNSKQVAKRLRAIDEAQFDVVIFLEYFPQNLCQYLSQQATDEVSKIVILQDAEGAHKNIPDMKMVEENIKSITNFMEEKGLLHFDSHHANIVTDGARLYFTDFGLAICQDFDLLPAEREFFAKHQGYDQALALSCFDWPTKTKDGEIITTLPEVKMIAEKYGEIAKIMNQFREDLRVDKSKNVEYPAAQIIKLFASK